MREFNAKKYRRTIANYTHEELVEALVREAELRFIAQEAVAVLQDARRHHITGRRYGHYVVLSSSGGKMMIQCDCGNIREKCSSAFGRTKSCGIDCMAVASAQPDQPR